MLRPYKIIIDERHTKFKGTGGGKRQYTVQLFPRKRDRAADLTGLPPKQGERGLSRPYATAEEKLSATAASSSGSRSAV